jgi:tyrosinase
MLYPIPNELTIGDYEVGFNTTMSDTDKSFIATVYPQDAPDVTALEVDGAAVDASIGEHGEEDRFRFTVSSGGKHVVQTDGPTDVVMALLGPDDPALLVTQDDDSGKGANAKIEAALEPGDYVVRIRHFLPTGTGTYSISVRRSNG